VVWEWSLPQQLKVNASLSSLCVLANHDISLCDYRFSLSLLQLQEPRRTSSRDRRLILAPATSSSFLFRHSFLLLPPFYTICKASLWTACTQGTENEADFIYSSKQLTSRSATRSLAGEGSISTWSLRGSRDPSRRSCM
jgi:hypothetical protein